MRILLVLFAIECWSGQAVAQGCTPQMVQQLQMRGAPPNVIAQMCGGMAVGGSPQPAMASVCATKLGFCPWSGPVNMNCSCNTQYGPAAGVTR